MVAQGDLWWLEAPDQKRRPVLVVSRNEAIPALRNVVVAPVTTRIRRIPTCIEVGPEHGLDHDSVISFDNLTTIPKSCLTQRIGRLDGVTWLRICTAMEAVAGCR